MFRHWKATMEYAKTKDILYLMKMLGHKDIKTTLMRAILKTLMLLLGRRLIIAINFGETLICLASLPFSGSFIDMMFLSKSMSVHLSLAISPLRPSARIDIWKFRNSKMEHRTKL